MFSSILFSINGIRNELIISMYTCILIEIIIAIFHDPLPDINHISNELVNLFYSGSHLYIFNLKSTRQVSALFLYPMQIHDSSLNIAFFQWFTLHDYFSIVHCNFLSCLGVTACFYLAFLCKFHFIYQISYNFVTNIKSHFHVLVLLYNFYFQSILLWFFNIETLTPILISSHAFFTMTIPFCLYLHQILNNRLGTTNIFCHSILYFFALFQLATLLMELCFLWISKVRKLVIVCKTFLKCRLI